MINDWILNIQADQGNLHDPSPPPPPPLSSVLPWEAVENAAASQQALSSLEYCIIQEKAEQRLNSTHSADSKWHEVVKGNRQGLPEPWKGIQCILISASLLYAVLGILFKYSESRFFSHLQDGRKNDKGFLFWYTEYWCEILNTVRVPSISAFHVCYNFYRCLCIIFSCMDTCVSGCGYAPTEVKRVRCSWAGVMGSCDAPDVGAENGARELLQSAMCSCGWALSSRLYYHFLIHSLHIIRKQVW